MSRPSGFKRTLAAIILTACAWSSPLRSQQTSSIAVSRIAGPIVSSQVTRLGDTVHPLVRAAKDAGAVPGTRTLDHMLLVLKSSPTQQAELDRLTADLQNPSSPSYHAWLTPQEFGKRFGPSQADLTRVSDWLRAQGMTVNGVAASGRWIDFSGSVANVNRTFQTAIRSYTVRQASHIANATDLSIPTALVPLVEGVAKLNDIHSPTPKMTSQRFTVKNGGAPVVTSASALQPNVARSPSPALIDASGNQFITPGDLQTIYNSAGLRSQGLDGTGVSIAVIGRATVQIADMQAFRQLFNLPANDPVIVNVGPTPVTGTGDELESALDLEYAGAIAPMATIKFVTADSTDTADGISLASAYAVDHLVAPILSISYGLCEAYVGTAGNRFNRDLWQQAATEGISVLVSSGDNGSAGCDATGGSPATSGLQISGLASTPFNTAVGGTQFQAAALGAPFWSPTNRTNLDTANGYVPETVWNETCDPTMPIGPANCSIFSDPQFATYVLLGGSGGASNCTISTETQNPDGTYSINCTGHEPKPSWQTGPGVPNDGARDIPDVSLTAAGSTAAYVVCVEGSCTFAPDGKGGHIVYSASTVGGTSASTPAFSGIVALLNQRYGTSQGLLNYKLYQLAAAQSQTACFASDQTDPAQRNACIFHDVTTGTNSVPCAGGSLDCSSTDPAVSGMLSGWPATSGYDRAVGLGSVDVTNLVNGWNSVNLQTAAVTLAITPTSGTHGAALAVSGTVAAASGNAMPTGSVTLQTGTGRNIGVFDVASGAYKASVNQLPGGSYTVQARYSGDAAFSPAISAAVNLNLSSEPSTTTLNLFGNTPTGLDTKLTVTYGDAQILRADVAGLSKHGNATGTVTFLMDGTPLVSSALTQDGSALFTTGSQSQPGIFPPVGQHSLVASYAGDSSFDPSTSKTINFTVEKEPVFTSVSSDSYSVLTKQPVVLVGYIYTYPDLPVAPTGTITFYDNGVAIGSSSSLQPVPVSLGYGAAQAAMSYAFPTSGTHQISVGYTGDSTFEAYSPTDHPIAFVVTDPAGLPTKIRSSTTSIHPVLGDGVNFFVTVDPVTPTTDFSFPTGTVTLSGGSLTFGGRTTVQLTGNSGQISPIFNAAGKVPVVFAYSGDSTFAPSSGGVIMVDVQKMSPPVTLTASSSLSLPSSQVVLQTSLPVSTRASTLPYPTGRVQLYDSLNGAAAVPLGAIQFISASNAPPLTTLAVATIAIPSLPLGVHTITSVYLGDTNYNSVTTAPVVVTVANPDFALATPAAGVSYTAGTSGSSTVTLSPSLGFTSAVSLSCLPSSVPAGTQCAVSPASLTGGKGTATVTLSAPATGLQSASLAPTAPLGSRRGPGGWPAGIAVACLVAAGLKRRRIGKLGLLTLTVFSGLILFSGCGSVAPGTPTINLASNKPSAAVGSTVTFTAGVISTNNTPLTGNVTFTSDAQSIGQAAALVQGVASLDVSSFGIGIHSLTATYNGDAKNLTATSHHYLQATTGDTTVLVEARSGSLVHTIAVPVHFR